LELGLVALLKQHLAHALLKIPIQPSGRGAGLQLRQR